MNTTEIIKNAKQKSALLHRHKADLRVAHVLGKYKNEGWIQAPQIKAVHSRMYLEDIFWVGEMVEPRVLELLPAILIKKPGAVYYKQLPEALRNAINCLKRKKLDGEFMGIALKDCYQWICRIGRKGKYPTITVSNRFTQEDYNLLNLLSNKLKKSKTEILRSALRLYGQSVQ